MRLVDHHHRLWNSVQNRTEQHPVGPLGIFGKKYFRPTYYKIEVGAWTALAPESTPPGGPQGVLRDASTNKHQTNLPMESRVPILVNRAVGSPSGEGRSLAMHIGPTAHTPLALGRIEVSLRPRPLGLTTNVRTFMMLAVDPGRSGRCSPPRRWTRLSQSGRPSAHRNNNRPTAALTRSAPCLLWALG